MNQTVDRNGKRAEQGSRAREQSNGAEQGGRATNSGQNKIMQNNLGLLQRARKGTGAVNLTVP